MQFLREFIVRPAKVKIKIQGSIVNNITDISTSYCINILLIFWPLLADVHHNETQFISRSG